MKFPYTVKANGKWYKPGEDVPGTGMNETSSAMSDGANLIGAPRVEEVQPEKVVEDEPKQRGRKPRQ